MGQSDSEFPDAPEILVEEAGKAEPPGHATRENDHLKGVPNDNDQDGDAGQKRGRRREHVRNCTCLTNDCVAAVSC